MSSADVSYYVVSRGEVNPSGEAKEARSDSAGQGSAIAAMKKSDWLILLLGFSGEGDSPALDPIRVQKGMFRVAKEAGLPEEERYTFGPYNWGAYSSDLRHDLDRLVHEDYVQTRDVPGYTWKRYGLTPGGLDYARHLLHEEVESPETVHKVAAIKRRVTGSSFNKLLDDVYSDYPESAVNSLFRK